MVNNESGRIIFLELPLKKKVITTNAVMMLWEEGKIRMDDPISNIFQSFRICKCLIRYWNFNETNAERQFRFYQLEVCQLVGPAVDD